MPADLLKQALRKIFIPQPAEKALDAFFGPIFCV
jgi:hypothetical protein